MSSLAARPQQDEPGDMGAGEARDAAEMLAAAAADTAQAVERAMSLTGAEPPEALSDLLCLLVGLQRRVTEATMAAERVYERGLSAGMIREAHRRQDYAAGWEDCLAARRRLRAAG